LTEKKFGDAEFVLDCRLEKPAEGKELAKPTVQLGAAEGHGSEVRLESARAGGYQRFSITVRGREVIVKRNDQEVQRLTLPADSPARGAFGLSDTGHAVEFMNLYAREL
jgi:hypothetical protein